jgi:hypothetical protein
MIWAWAIVMIGNAIVAGTVAWTKWDDRRARRDGR